MAVTHGAVERLDDLIAVALLGRDEDSHRSPRPGEELGVARGEVPALVQDGEAHDVKGHLNVADLRRLKEPA